MAHKIVNNSQMDLIVYHQVVNQSRPEHAEAHSIASISNLCMDGNILLAPLSLIGIREEDYFASREAK